MFGKMKEAMTLTTASCKLNIDIVVPSARVDIEKLRLTTSLKVPDNVLVHFYFVIDKPHVSKIFAKTLFQDEAVTVIRNDTNIGAHLSRNKGFEAGSGEYVLFLDDDTEIPSNLLAKYLEAIKKDPNSPGFVGPVRFPSCINSYTKAAAASDILTFWDIAKTTPQLAWGITANLMVKRESVGDIRFSSNFPKRGGGEDVDFCLRIVEKCGTWFTSVPDAELVHPWWDHGKHQYKRFARWAYGDSTLPVLHPKYKFRNAPNFLESVLILSLFAVIVFALFKFSIEWFFAWLMIAFFLELFMDGLRMRLAGKKQTPIVSIQATTIRLSNDLGRIIGHLKHMHFSGITERFDYFMTKEHLRYERIVAVSKFVIYILTAILLLTTLG
jgi:GT2 family glycosyltransferase